jgi:hypothetical protein
MALGGSGSLDHPALVVVFMQRWFVKGLVDTEK